MHSKRLICVYPSSCLSQLKCSLCGWFVLVSFDTGELWNKPGSSPVDAGYTSIKFGCVDSYLLAITNVSWCRWTRVRAYLPANQGYAGEGNFMNLPGKLLC